MSSDLLSTLNPAQQQAVRATEGPVLVLAGPGSGKTRVLTHRVAYLIEEVGVDPFQILAVTFTNKAAREMKARLELLIGPGRASALSVGTFHSLCTRFLRRDIIHLGRERDFAIYDADDQERLMRRVLKDLNLDEKRNPPRAIRGSISSAKNELVGPEEFARLNRSPFDRVVYDCYVRYQALLKESNALDFDDLLMEAVRLFQQPAQLARYHERYRYLMVDEYQDTNRAQYTLVKLLAAKQRNVFAVGDDDQGVYSWRGADIRNILQFEDDYPEVQVIILEQNYRSTQGILDVAQALINGGAKRKHIKKLWTQNGEGLLVSLQEAYDQDEEARLVADEIKRLVSGAGDTDGRPYRLGDCAIMYRTNAQSRALEEALRSRGLPYQLVGGTNFYQRKEIKDVLAYLRLAHNPFDSVSLGRVLNVPARGIGERTEDELGRWASGLGMPIYQALQELALEESELLAAAPGSQAAKSPFAPRTRAALLRFLALIESLIEARLTLGIMQLLELTLERLEFREALLREYGPDEGEDRWNNVQELFTVAAEYMNMPQEAQLPTFLEEIALVADVDSMDKQTDVVTCITLHQAKGLEYPAVFLVGLEEGLLPHSRSIDDRDQLEEERRLLYVGATRAQRRLYMLYAFKRTVYGRTNTSVPSRFLADIPRSLLKQQPRRDRVAPTQSSVFGQRSQYSGGDRARGSLANAPSPAARQPRQAAPSEASFAPGQRVRHATFGEGVVMSSKLVEGDEEVTVAFEQKGQKRLLASFANLQKVT